ncbi:uncharacterized protein CC84DRAFT_1165425 [Paraphaeosphaeria sporulosa]|uniref:NAD(P)-binding protein n=1 Tax=Paraphaeosphaeria sporulosa TaxID=1460663 RepID=A0A177CBQ5_9PLEO|nr:uncharacterized protein CC84DRAFT_1165425 [Paraphaeosphaeria sporulosa]OAG05094.1 hypothetical protein CC84DRAFT_1165425 [Paraphaeosphaeria sporulosa]
MASSIPVILCGRTEGIGAGVIEALKPEIEVIHFILTPEAGKNQIPALLKGDKNVLSDSGLGSKNYERTAEALLLGAGYSEEEIEEMREASKEVKGVPWLRPDTEKPAPPLGPEYGKALVARIKETMNGLAEKGEMGQDAVVWY